MQKHSTRLKDLYLIDLDVHVDTRGAFARSFCENEFKKWELETHFPQTNLSWNLKKGTFRGMHFQKAPHEETKLISCVSGRAYDVLLDLRPKSPTFQRWQAFEISADKPQVLYVPKGFAHGFLTLEDQTTLLYQMSEFYQPVFSDGVRWNDPKFQITWPFEPKIISDKDQSYPDFQS